jgi:hypothetical protein
MHAWVEKILRADNKLSEKVKEQYLITLKWYLGFCVKESLGEPTERENEKIFWRQAVEKRDLKPEAWQKKQWGEAMKRFYSTLVSLD